MAQFQKNGKAYEATISKMGSGWVVEIMERDTGKSEAKFAYSSEVERQDALIKALEVLRIRQSVPKLQTAKLCTTSKMNYSPQSLDHHQ